jgi:hypothetical protein
MTDRKRVERREERIEEKDTLKRDVTREISF